MQLMRYAAIACCFFLLQGEAPAGNAKIKSLPTSAVSTRTTLLSHLGRDATYFVTKEGRREATYDIATPDEAKRAAKAYLSAHGDHSRADVDALAFLILTQAATATRSDLMAISRELSQVNLQQAHLRNLAYSADRPDLSQTSSALKMAMDHSSRTLDALNSELAKSNPVDKNALKALR
jgi:hypothetical protein